MADYLAGFNAKALINNVRFAFQTYRLRMTGTHLDVSNSEGFAGNSLLITPQIGAVGNTGPTATVFTSRLPGLISMEGTITSATFDAAANPFIAPILLDVNLYVSIVVFYALGGPNWAADSFLVGEVATDADVRGLQPITFSGESDGGFTIFP